MASGYNDTDEFRGAGFHNAELSGAAFRDCNLTDVRIVSSIVTNLHVSGFGGNAAGVVVDDVDVSGYVSSELDRRYPERVQLRAIKTADDLRAMWTRLDQLWLDTLARAEQLPETMRHERVNGEWSFVETLRHLVFAVDVWIGRMMLDTDRPFHRLGLPPTDYPAEGIAELGVELEAQAPYAEVVAIHADARASIRQVLEDLSDTQLDHVRTGVPAPAWGVESYTVAECLRVPLEEHCEHRRYAVRDLAVLEASSAVPANDTYR